LVAVAAEAGVNAVVAEVVVVAAVVEVAGNSPLKTDQNKKRPIER